MPAAQPPTAPPSDLPPSNPFKPKNSSCGVPTGSAKKNNNHWGLSPFLFTPGNLLVLHIILLSGWSERTKWVQHGGDFCVGLMFPKLLPINLTPSGLNFFARDILQRERERERDSPLSPPKAAFLYSRPCSFSSLYRKKRLCNVVVKPQLILRVRTRHHDDDRASRKKTVFEISSGTNECL